MNFKRRGRLDCLFFLLYFSIDLRSLRYKFLHIILVFSVIPFANEQTWTTTTFDYYWNKVLRRNIYREPISFTPFDIRIGQLTYGGSDYWDNKFFNDNLGLNLPVKLDATTNTFSIINSHLN